MKAIFLIDGFNVYHSIKSVKVVHKTDTRWLDLRSLCKSYLYLFGKEAHLSDIFYFSAIPLHLIQKHPDKINRQQNYLKCLNHSGVNVELGRFKEKHVYCDICKNSLLKHEEKETDVAIAIKLFEICYLNLCEIVVIVSGDTDIAPAVRTCNRLFPSKQIVFAFPFARKNKELLRIAPKSFSIGFSQYVKYQFPNPVIAGEKKIFKPVGW